MTQTGMQCHSTALGKSGKNYLFRWNTRIYFCGDVLLNYVCRAFYGYRIFLSAQIHISDVIPGPHGHAAIDSHRPDRCMWKYKTDAETLRQIQFGYNRYKIMAIGTQTMKPDDGGTVVMIWFDDNSVLMVGHGISCWFWS